MAEIISWMSAGAAWAAPAGLSSIFVGQHHGRARFAVLARVKPDLQQVPTRLVRATERGLKRVPTGNQSHLMDVRHQQDVMPEIGEGAGVVGSGVRRQE